MFRLQNLNHVLLVQQKLWRWNTQETWQLCGREKWRRITTLALRSRAIDPATNGQLQSAQMHAVENIPMDTGE